MKSLDTSKTTGTDTIFAEFVKMSGNIINFYLSNIIACNISENKYFKHAKRAIIVRPVSRKDDRKKIKNYRPVRI